MALDKVNVGQAHKHRNVPLDANKKDIGDKNVKAKGIGMFKKMWLHMSGKAGNRHSRQLNNLKAQIRASFSSSRKGNAALKELNKVLNEKGWGDASTKLFSSTELRTLRALSNSVVRTHVVEFLKNPETFKVFDSFGKERSVDESISFLKEMLPLSSVGVSGKDIDTKTLIGIYDRFIPANAKKQINLPSDIDGRLKMARENLDKAIKSYDQSKIDKAKDQLHLALNLARGNIVHLIKTDVVMKVMRDKKFGPQMRKAGFNLVHKFEKKGGLANNRTKLIEVDKESLPIKKKAPKKSKIRFSRKKKKAVRRNDNVQVRNKPNAKVGPKPVKRLPEPDAPMRPIKADRPLRKAKADKPEPVIKREKAPDPNAKLKKALAKAPGVKGRFNQLNDDDFKKIVNDLKKEGTVYSKNTELLFINKAKEVLANKA